jgi:hypothetical protein
MWALHVTCIQITANKYANRFPTELHASFSNLNTDAALKYVFAVRAGLRHRGPYARGRGGPSLSSLLSCPLPYPLLLYPLPSPLSMPASLPSPPIRSWPPKFQLGGLGERCKLPSGVWGRAPGEIEFGAFSSQI